MSVATSFMHAYIVCAQLLTAANVLREHLGDLKQAAVVCVGACCSATRCTFASFSVLLLLLFGLVPSRFCFSLRCSSLVMRHCRAPVMTPGHGSLIADMACVACGQLPLWLCHTFECILWALVWACARGAICLECCSQHIPRQGCATMPAAPGLVCLE